MNIFKLLESILIGIVALLVAACSPSKPYMNYENNQTENIIGGLDLSRAKTMNKSVVFILNQNAIGSANICTGTFITETIIITAAHCVSEDKNDLVVQMGNSIFSDQITYLFHVIKVKKHQQYKQGENDLALILVEKSKTVSVIPVELAKHTDLSNNKKIILLGYGVDQILESDDEFQGAGDLRSLSIQPSRLKLKQFTFSIDQTDGSGACHGDSGGPAFVTSSHHQMVLVGIASGLIQSEDETDCANRSVYTKVSTYKSWILKSIEWLDYN